MNAASPTTPGFPLIRSIGIVASVWCVGVAIAAATLALLAGYGLAAWAMYPTMLATSGVCLVASLGFLLPLWWRVGSCKEGMVQGAMIGMLVRLGLTLGGAAALVLILALDQQAVAGWTIGWYLLMLVTEVMFVVRFLHEPAIDGARGGMEDATC